MPTTLYTVQVKLPDTPDRWLYLTRHGEVTSLLQHASLMSASDAQLVYRNLCEYKSLGVFARLVEVGQKAEEAHE